MQLKKRHRKFVAGRARRCYYCGDVLTRRSASIDHKFPRSRGGSEETENKCLCCKACNHKKDDLTVEEFRWKLILERGETVTFFGESSQIQLRSN